MTNNNNNAVNFERMRSPPNGKGAGGRKKPRRHPPSPPRVGCRQAALVQMAPSLGQTPLPSALLPAPFFLSLGEQRRLYAGFTEPPAPAALPPPPLHWTRPIAVA